MIFRVYCIKNKDRVLYVGATRQTLSRRRWAKYPFEILDDYRWELLAEVDNENQMYELEKYFIKHFDTIQNGLNKSTGGKGGTTGVKQSPELIERRIAGHRGRKNTAETKAKMSESSPRKKPVICLETGVMFDSARSAANIMKLDYKKISLVAQGKRRSTGGFRFEFVVTMGS